MNISETYTALATGIAEHSGRLDGHLHRHRHTNRFAELGPGDRSDLRCQCSGRGDSVSSCCADCALSGYRWGVERKRALLKREGRS